MKWQMPVFLENKKNNITLSSAELAHRVVKMNTSNCIYDPICFIFTIF